MFLIIYPHQGLREPRGLYKMQVKMQGVCVFSNITLCDSAKDDEGGEDACQRTGAEVRGPVTGSPSLPTAGSRQLRIF